MVRMKQAIIISQRDVATLAPVTKTAAWNSVSGRMRVSNKPKPTSNAKITSTDIKMPKNNLCMS